jgi:hypothetical protein
MERRDSFALATIVGASIVLASTITALTAWHAPVAATVRPVSAASRQPTKPIHETLVIATPDMLGSKEMPAYIPAALTLPANTTVTVTIVNFDDATALPRGSEQYATARGVIGPLSIQQLDAANPNADAPATTATALDPEAGVSHTFTISKLGINVPVAPKSKTTFTFRTGRAGTYDWQCFDPCGTDPAGWGGAMATTGFMRGVLTVV